MCTRALARYAIEPDQLDDAVESFREAGRELAAARRLRGRPPAGRLTTRATLLTLTLWERPGGDGAGARFARPVCASAALRTVDGEVQSVTCYEVPFELG